MIVSTNPPRVVGERIVGERFIIADESFVRSARERLQELEWCGESPKILEGEELSSELDSLLVKLALGERTLVVWPGNGAQWPRGSLCFPSRFAQTEVPARRIWVPGTDPICQAGTILPEGFLFLQVEVIVVIDDVISSGGTMHALHRANAWRFPRARWLAATWVSQRLRTRPASGLGGFSTTIAAVQVEKPSGLRSAVNSLSTLRYNRDVAESYAERHLCRSTDRYKFLELIK